MPKLITVDFSHDYYWQTINVNMCGVQCPVHTTCLLKEFRKYKNGCSFV